ncbi:MAG TPA: ATPase domain-containing protein [Methylomirabilota bacterium]|nr:ATPase domain-containing protein [Methylomirabilota bacterium]
MSKPNGSPTVKRISTGVAGIDVLLQGGFLSGRSYLVTGDAGTGKTTACMQFLMAGLQENEKAVYVTVDERPGEILQSAASLEWDLQSYVQEKSLVILDASPYFSGRAALGGDKGLDLSKFVTDLAGYANKLDAMRLVIDPVTPLILSGDSPSRVQENARTLIHLLQSHLTTTNLLTSHLPAQGNHDSTQGIEEFLAAGVIVLSVAQANERLVRRLGVKKMRGTAVNPDEHPFNIVKGKGIVLLSSEKKAIVVEDISPQGLEFFELPKE